MRGKAVYLEFAFIVLVILSSCNYKDKKNSDFDTADTLLTKTILFPDKLSLLKGNQFQKIDSLRGVIKHKKKVISIVDGTCMSCIISQLNVMDSTFNSILSDDSALIFILNVSKADSAYFMLNLQPAIKATGVILWDDNYNFERHNNLFTTDSNLRTFMTNREDKIIQYGNPVMNPDLISKYQEKVTN